jgi:hypothetical protein
MELLAELGIEVTACLVISKCLMSISRSFERIPRHKHRSGAFILVEAQQKVCKADDRSSAFPTPPSNRFRERMIGSVRNGITIDHKQRSAHDRPSGKQLAQRIMSSSEYGTCAMSIPSAHVPSSGPA